MTLNTVNEIFAAGLIVLRLSTMTDSGGESLALVTRGCIQTLNRVGASDATTDLATVYSTHAAIDLDQQVHLAPAAPPADANQIALTLTYQPLGGPVNVTSYPVRFWVGNIDVQYLTSQPGP